MNKKMRAAVLVRNTSADKAFEIRELQIPEVPDNFVLIQVESFGLNYADVMARKGQYRDAPPMPSVLGYDVCGRIYAVGKKVTLHQVGDRVTALTRFGGYAEFAVTDERAAVKIEQNTDSVAALSLATQGATAWYSAEEVCSLYKNERVVITAAAGGVGSLLVQLAKLRDTKVYGIVSTEGKEQIGRSLGADGVLNRSKGDIFQQYQAFEGKKAIDVMFDSAGGSYVKKGIKNLAPGGRMVCYGGSQGSNANNIFKLIPFALSFGFYHPVPFLMNSQAIIGVNMLRLADHKPDVLKRCIEEPVKLFNEGKLKPLAGKLFSIEHLADAHEAIEHGKVPGKVAVKW
jgi:NADPH:quinone reductase-like Zn-dependent oxidoreductase